MVRFKKIGENSNLVHADKQRIRLEPKYKERLLRQLKKGEAPSKVKKSSATIKKNQKRKSVRANKSAVKKANAKGRASAGSKRGGKASTRSGARKQGKMGTKGKGR